MKKTHRIALACGLLLASFASLAAQPIAKFSSLRHEFGTLLWNDAKTVDFIITNGGTRELRIKEVHPDCGCTTAHYTQTPIAPGKTGVISITFDASMLGQFEKQVAVYTNADTQPRYITIGGDVVRELKEYSGEYPYKVGDLYLGGDVVEFDNVFRGETPTQILTLHNAGRKPYTPTLMHLPSFLTVTAEPAIIRPGRSGRIYLTLDSERLRRIGLTQTSIYLSRYAGDRISRENEIMVSATLLPESSAGTVNLENAPVASLSSTSIMLKGEMKKNKLKGQVMLTNTGKSNLEIGALQVYNPGIGASVAKRIIKPGKSVPIKITLNKDTDNFKGRRRVLLITNDPITPQIVIEVNTQKQ